MEHINEDIKVGDKFEDLEKRHRGKVRVLEVVRVDAGAGRAACKVWIDGKDVEREVFILRRRLVGGRTKKDRCYLRVLRGGFVPASTPGQQIAELHNLSAPGAPEASPTDGSIEIRLESRHSLDSKSVGPLNRLELALLEERMRRWPATHYHKRLMLTLRQNLVALEVALEDAADYKARALRAETFLEDLSRSAAAIAKQPSKLGRGATGTIG